MRKQISQWAAEPGNLVTSVNAADLLLISRNGQDKVISRPNFLLTGRGVHVKASAQLTLPEGDHLTFWNADHPPTVVYDDFAGFVNAGATPVWGVSGFAGVQNQSLVLPFAGSYLVELFVKTTMEGINNSIELLILDDANGTLAGLRQEASIVDGTPEAGNQGWLLTSVIRVAANARIHYQLRVLNECFAEAQSYFKCHFLG
jgi:hypothetical protein